MAILSGIYEALVAAPSVASLLGSSTAVYFSVAQKGALPPYVVLHVVDGLPAEASLDGVSELIDGEIQFDSYGSDQLAARKLSRAVRDLLKNFGGALPDGTTIQFVDVTMDMDDPFEIGGQGYVDRSVLRLKAFYTEAQ
jgi:hypothetical protein